MTHPQTDDILHIPQIPALASHAELRQWAQITRDLLIRFSATKAQAEACNCDEADFSFTASDIAYDNATSGLTADDVQDAIDEIDADLASGLEMYSSPAHLEARFATAMVPGTNYHPLHAANSAYIRSVIPANKKLVVTYASLRVQTGATAGTYTFTLEVARWPEPNTTASSTVSEMVQVSSTETSTYLNAAAVGTIASPIATVLGDVSDDDVGFSFRVRNENSSPGNAGTNHQVFLSGYIVDQ